MKVNVVFIGHVDHGKSTLIGRLLYDSDNITEGRVDEIQKLAEEYKHRFEFAYFLDSFQDEIEEERTIDTTSVMFKGKNLYVVTDVPGHKEFIKNMLTGASHANVAVLVVAADDGIQEQTKRHTFLTNMLGIKQVFVVVNKMDSVAYSSEGYQRLTNEVKYLLESFGLQAAECIPGSALEGDNIYKHSDRMPWYRGPTLIEALDRMEVTEESKPVRFVVQDTYLIDSTQVVAGRVESGTLYKDDHVIFQPSGANGKVKSIKVWNNKLTSAKAGDSIGIVVSSKPERGDVCGLVGNPPVAVREFLGEVVLIDSTLSKGDVVELRCGTRNVQCEIKEIKEKISCETGEVIQRYSDRLDKHEAATVLFNTEPLVVEKFSEIPELGRYILVRDGNIGAGIVLETIR